jgi:UDPglucose 6-dehydrogenase
VTVRSLNEKAITVAGAAGYVGLISALEFARLGRTVWCVDVVPEKIASLIDGEPPFVEPGLSGLLRDMIDAGRLRFATSYEEAIPESGFVVIALPTPSPHGTDIAYDMDRIYACIDDMVGCGLGSDHALVMKSTVPCGAGRDVTRYLADEHGREVPYISCPEFLREGSALADAEQPDRILIGHAGTEAGRALADLFSETDDRGRRKIAFGELREVGIESAELVKLASNGWLATQICVINEIANLCDTDAVRADVVELAAAMARRELPGDFLKAGIGFAGPCFPKDVHGLRGVAIKAGLPFELLDVVLDVNRRQPGQAVRKARLAVRTLEGKTIALLGASFKANTSDTRDSMAVDLICALVAAGAEVVVCDPEAKQFEAKEMERLPDSGWRFVDSNSEDFEPAVDECLRGADLAILATNWPQFKDIEWRAHGTRLNGVVDGRNLLDPTSVRDAGLAYDGIGRRITHRAPDERLQGRALQDLADRAAFAMLAVKRSFMAEMAAIAERAEANWSDVAEGIALDRRIGPECVSESTIDSSELDAGLDAMVALASRARYRFETAVAAAADTRATI